MRPGEPSLTARRVAAQRLAFERVPAPYGDAAAEEALARDVAGDLAGMGPGGMGRYLAARTLFFDRFVVDGLGVGIDQVVVLAAGYDGRPYRYAKPGTAWFEVDHPDTQADKRARLERLAIDTGEVAFVAADFAVERVDEALAGAGFDRERSALFLCEGVAVYLDQPVLEDLMAATGRAAAPGSRLAISVSLTSADPAVVERRRRFSERVAAIGEEAKTVLPAGAAEEMLRRHGWLTDRPDGDGPAYRAGLLTARAA